MFEFEESKPAKKKTESIKIESTPVETVEETKDKVQKPKYNADELLKIFDEIVFSGEYTDRIKIKGKLNVAFRTRSADQISTITSKLDSTPANLISTVSERRALYNLHYALVEYQGKNLVEMSVENREAFLKKLPAPIIGALMVALSKFDDKVFEACKDGEENF